MGEHADDAVQYFIDTKLDVTSSQFRGRKRRSFQKGSGNYKWRTLGGHILDMRKMSLEHIDNCIKMCDVIKNTAKAQQFEEVRMEMLKQMENKHV